MQKWGKRQKSDILFDENSVKFTCYDVVLIGVPANYSRHTSATFAYGMSAAGCIRIVFFHSHPAVFTAESVENLEKSRNSTTNSVDKYVDGVDRTVNIHQNA